MSTTAAVQILVRQTRMNERADFPEQFWDLIERYRGELINQAVAILGSVEDAEDVVQETFCEALRDQERLAKARSLGALLRAINRANALNRMRDDKRDVKKTERKQVQAPERPFTTGGFSALELRDTVAKAIETLPPHLRTVVALRYWEHLSYEEIAVRLKVPPGTVGRLLYDASMVLYDRLNVHLQAPGQKPPAAPPQPASATPEAPKEIRE